MLPASSQVLTSLDGTTWTPAPVAGADGSLSAPVSARYVRVEFTRDPTAGRTALRELEVIHAP